MSNFICPTCGLTNIYCGKAGHKTDREIELEKKLEIAIEALGKLKNRYCVACKCGERCSLLEYYKQGKGCSYCVAELAQQALKEIEECTYSEKA